MGRIRLDHRWPFPALQPINTMRTVVTLPQTENETLTASERGNEFKGHVSKDLEEVLRKESQRFKSHLSQVLGGVNSIVNAYWYLGCM